jgi:carboxypeptidase Q
MTRLFALALALAIPACGTTPAASTNQTPSPAAAPAPAAEVDPIAAAYGDVAKRIIAAAREDRGEVWKKLEQLTVHIGPRLAGSEGLDRAIAWAEQTLRAEGHESVAIEPIKVPHWVRGAESAAVVKPRAQPLSILGLGGTVATPEGGIAAEVLVVSSRAELDRRVAEVKGKLVLLNPIMAEYDRDKGDGYDKVYKYRNYGADWASAHGAAAVLVRSLTTRSLATPHTGGLRYSGKVKKIPAAAVSLEGAELISRLAARGPVEVRLELSGRTLGEVDSGNVIAELRGSEKPEEIVVIGAHIDSWDIGQGAHDDAGGCAVMMQALSVLRRLDLRPRRTIRVVLFTNEENGLRGAFGYARAHAGEIKNHVAAMESDGGVFAPRGWLIEGGEQALEHARSIAGLLAPVKATEVRAGFSGADLIPLVEAGVPGVGHWVEGERYFDLHHTAADTIDKVDPGELVDNVAAVAVFAYVAADMEPRFGAR